MSWETRCANVVCLRVCVSVCVQGGGWDRGERVACFPNSLVKCDNRAVNATAAETHCKEHIQYKKQQGSLKVTCMLATKQLCFPQCGQLLCAGFDPHVLKTGDPISGKMELHYNWHLISSEEILKSFTRKQVYHGADLGGCCSQGTSM